MLFHSFAFAIFFVVVFTLYWRLREHRSRMILLLGASCVFYMSWNPWLISLILFSASIDFFMAQKMEEYRSPRTRRLLLLTSISVNLGLLAFFKYTGFFLTNAHALAAWCGWDFELSSTWKNIILPLGISFYTFETISYITDVYLGRAKAERNLLDYALYIMFFPHLVAGPIVRPRDFLPQLKTPKRFSLLRCYAGLKLFLLGLIKKAVIADQLAGIADTVFKSPGAYGSLAVWLAVLCYAVQIYCDFSGYSDMAIGVAHTLGFKLPANFRMPYFSANITEFWRRWHISLSSWLRDYVYVPLGGNRHGTWNTYRNLILTMLLGGLWHGANWTFVAWGLYHGVLLALHRLLPRPAWSNSPFYRPFAVAGTFLLVCIGWVFFRAQTFGEAGILLSHMFQPAAGFALQSGLVVIALLCFAVLLAAHLVGTFVRWDRLERNIPAPLMGIALGSLFLVVQLLIPVDSKAFIYFQF